MRVALQGMCEQQLALVVYVMLLRWYNFVALLVWKYLCGFMSFGDVCRWIQIMLSLLFTLSELFID